MRETQIALANLVQRNPSSMDRHVCRCRLRLSRLATDPKSPGRGIFGYPDHGSFCFWDGFTGSVIASALLLLCCRIYPSATIHGHLNLTAEQGGGGQPATRPESK